MVMPTWKRGYSKSLDDIPTQCPRVLHAGIQKMLYLGITIILKAQAT